MDIAKRISLHVVASNHSAVVSALADSLDSQTSRDWQMIVVDNASNDGLAEMLKSAFSGVIALRNFKNQGYARAHNQAMTFALSRWEDGEGADRVIGIVQPEILFASDALEKIGRAFKEDPDVACVAPKIRRANVVTGFDGEAREIGETDVLESVGLVMKKSRRWFEQGAGEKDEGQFDEAPEPFGPPSACFFFRASAMQALAIDGEWMDQDLPEGQEIADLFWRARLLGMRVRIVPDAIVWRQPVSTAPTRGFARLAYAYTRAGRRAWLSRAYPLLIQTKNDTVLNRILHFPWLFARRIGRFFSCLVNPPKILLIVKTCGSWAAMRNKRQSLWKRVTVKSKDVRRRFE